MTGFQISVLETIAKMSQTTWGRCVRLGGTWISASMIRNDPRLAEQVYWTIE